MTSSRGQNVSIFQHPGKERWKPPIATFADTGGSLLGVSRENSSSFGKNASMSEKSSGQHSFKNSPTGAYANSRNKDFTPTNAFPNALLTNSVNSSSIMISMNRELSPVRWCDRKVDGVYLGRSGWVQVQQRSLDDGRGLVYGDNGFSTLPSRKQFSEMNSNPDERRECNRPFNLPLSSKKRTVRENYERPSKFVQQFESISPPSVTPIISPPPAFKDEVLNVEFPRQSVRKSLYSEEAFLLRSETSSCSPKERRSNLQSSPSEISGGSTVSTQRHERLPYRTSQTKSLEEDSSNRIWRDRRFNSFEPFTILGFRSLDNDARTGGSGAVKANDGDLYKNFEAPKGRISCDECDREDNESNEEADSNGRFLGMQNSSKEGLRNSSKAFRLRNYQRNGRRTSSSYRTRSPSSDSSTSTSTSSSSSSSSSSSGFSGKNSEKLVTSRRTSSKDKQTFEFEDSSSRDSKHFYVKRSRSLQLSERKSPSESALNHSSSGKSWDPMPPEYLTYQVTNQNCDSSGQFPQHLHHVLVTVNGDSIPVGTSASQSLKCLNKITTSEEEQKKLIIEAEKEARIISEFLNGTRSRAAARNLLMHRYLNRHEASGSVESAEDLHPKTEYDSHFLEANRRSQNKANFWSDVNYGRESFCKKSRPSSSNSFPRQHPTTISPKPFTSFFRASNPSSRAGSAAPQILADQRKKERLENKESGGSYSASGGQCAKDRRPRNKTESVNRFLDQTCSAVNGPHLLSMNPKQKPKNERLESDPEASSLKRIFKNGLQILSAKNADERNFVESSSLSSSSSTDICQVDVGTKSKTETKTIDASSPYDDLALGGISEMPPEMAFGSVSAPGSDDSNATGADHRSLSLPRSFLSERYRLNYSNQRDLLRKKQNDVGTLEEAPSESPVSSQRSRTAPTTPTRDLRYGKSPESLSQTQCIGSSCTMDELEESPVLIHRRIVQKITQEKPERSEANSSGGDTFLIYKNPLQISENSTGRVIQKLKKKFPLKYLKTKGNFKDHNELIHQESENGSVEDSSEVTALACHLISGLQTVESDDQAPEKALRFAKEQNGRKKCLKNEKYDSHDSGIQMGNRGNMDSSESQDTDLQEDVDSPLLADIQWRAKIKKQTYGKGVRRTNSDVGSHKSFNLDVKNSGRSLSLASYPSPVGGRHAKTISGLPSPEDAALLNRLIGTQLRRSLSQPLGLNEMTPVSRRSSILKGFALSEDERNPRGKNSEDECLSDSESSVASLQERKRSFDCSSKEETVILAEAVWDHVAIESCELPFRAGDVIEVLDTQNWDWWWGATAENRGYFPSAFVRLRVNQEDTVEDCLAAMAKGSNRLRRGKSVSLLSNDQVRSSIVRELLNTEQDFVKILRDLKDGYVEQCKRRTDMFTSAQITTIFSNLEDLLVFQEKFLKDLDARVNREFPYKSCIGQVFLIHGSGFRMYSEYCNSHPMAIATLQDLYQKDGYCKFFETCRLKQSLIEIPLDGYLLTPVQRICKYPLQLAELLKYTKPDHPDFREVEEALETMRAVATLINERKRKMESLEKLAAWQQRVEGWEGEDLIEISSQLIHQGDVVRITSGVWTSNITLFLFDHQIVYCKKDLLKRNVYIYKGRIFLDASVIVDVPDGKNQQLGVTIKYGLKICSSIKDKWLLFCCRSSEDKAKWLEALTEERRIVAQDKEVGLDLPPTAKRLAKMAARTKKCPPFKLRGKNKTASNHEEMSFRNCHPGASKTKSSRRVGTWFTFGGVIKNSKTSLRPRTSLHRIT